MPNVNDVIKGLECCLNADVNNCEMDCPYFNDCGGFFSNNTALMEDALALLREYAEMEKTYSQVLMETTGNLLSKTNYTLVAIMDRIREHYCDGCDIREELDTLLKVQEPKLVHVTADINHRKIGECPTCGKWINSGDYPNYCGHCGQAVRWG